MLQDHLKHLFLLLLAAFILNTVLIFTNVTWIGHQIDVPSFQKNTQSKEIEPFFEAEYIGLIDNNTVSLFRHAVLPTYIRNDILSKIHKVSLVISHCDHPLNWIAQFTNGFENIIKKVWIFTKCGQDVIDAPPGAEIIKLPNVGRCDHTYAYWMNHYFYTESNTIVSTHEIIVFMKDTDYLLEKSDNRTFGDMLSLAVTNGLGCMMRTDIVTSILHEYDMLRKMTLDSAGYGREDGADFGGEQILFHNDNFQNLGEWIDKLQISPTALTQNIVPVCYGGVWAVTSYQIAKHSKRVWKAIEESLSRGDNIVEGHYAERIWACLLSKPLSNASAKAVWEMNPTVHEHPYFFRGQITLSGDAWNW